MKYFLVITRVNRNHVKWRDPEIVFDTNLERVEYHKIVSTKDKKG